MSHFRFTTSGESHGPSLTTIVSGMPAGVKLDRNRIDRDLARRQLGYGRGSRMKIERDVVEVQSGIRGGETLGSPITFSIRNLDFDNWKELMDPWSIDPTLAQSRRVHAPRPGHVDLAGGLKYNRRDLRDVLERASARETAARVAAGAIAKALLLEFDIEIRSAVLSIGSAGDPTSSLSWDELMAVDEESPVHAAKKSDEEAMITAIDQARENGDTLGGAILLAARGVPVGLGSYVSWDQKLDGRIGQAILSVHAVKAVAIGDGVAAAGQPGSSVHDAIYFEKSQGFYRQTNRAGGLEGGVTNGQPVVVRAFMKPISTTRRGLPSVDIDSKEEHRSQWERSDVTAVPACAVVCEAMLAVVLADAMRQKFGGDSLGEMKRNFDGYLDQVHEF